MQQLQHKPCTSIAFGMALICLVPDCSANQQSAAPRRTITSDEALAVATRVIDCEQQAANRYDDGLYTITDLANRVMGVCTVERMKAKIAFGLSPNDPQLELDDFKQAVGIVEEARKTRPAKRKNSN